MSKILEKYSPETNIVMHKSIRFNKEMIYAEKLFYAELVSLCEKHPKNVCFFSSRKLGEYFGVSHQTIINWIKKLLKLNIIEIGVDFNNKGCNKFIKMKKR